MQDDSSDTISKTQRKREMLELQELGERLTGLNDEQLAGLDIPEDLRDAVADSRRITRHEARRRHMQFIGRLMRSVDPEPIRNQLAEWDGVSTEATAALHRIERVRDALLADDAALARFAADHPGCDIQRLRTLIRGVREDRAAGKPARHYRDLFREIKRLDEARAQPDAD
jgi:ribosome-associated protein